MLDLAKSTGVQRGSLYNAYGDKEEIFLRVFERYADRFIADARKALNKPDPRDALDTFFAFAVQSITKGSPARGCLSASWFPRALNGKLWPNSVRPRPAEFGQTGARVVTGDHASL